jgi:hypothetical protein
VYFVPEGRHDSSQARSAWDYELELTMPSTVPPGRGLFAYLPRHFVPGYYRAVPSGTKTIRLSKRLALSQRLWVETLG